MEPWDLLSHFKKNPDLKHLRSNSVYISLDVMGRGPERLTWLDKNYIKIQTLRPCLRTSDLRALYQSQETCTEWAPHGDSGAGGLRTNYHPGSLQR